MNSTDTNKEARLVLTGIYRQMSVPAKVRKIFEAYQTGQMLAIAGLKLSFPKASQTQLRRLWLQRHLGEKLFNNIYGNSKCRTPRNL